MTNEIKYYDTPYSYVSPIRYFKANDPYYYEVDNIPIKQLEESQRFLKDQVDGIITKQNNKKEIEIDRSNFSELRPYATGSERKVRVKPGRYTSRINNAFNLTPLQVVRQIAGFSNSTITTNGEETISDLNTWRVETNIGNYVSNVLAEFQQGIQGDALNMNGLAERAFVFPFYDEDGWHLNHDLDSYGPSSVGYSQFDSVLDPDDRPLYPNYIGAILKHNTVDTTRDLTLIKNVYDPTARPFGGQQGRIESEFIKRWRGAIRTSVVDVPEELEITVPDFNVNANNEPEDFFYYDVNGNKKNLEARHRIDLLFIYSKAIDEEETTIPKFDSAGNPTTLTAPALGILKGAGIGISRSEVTPGNSNDAADDRVNLQSLDGTPIMLAHPGDEAGATNGFTTSAGVIKGSFPSPDDLMNLAPVLSENLETDSFALIGQSILPVAYIRVQKSSGPIPDIINDEDIIDIRPFFRTTELAYNERAGIAAATPQVSIANPVVTEAHLEKVRKEVYSDLRVRIDGIANENRMARNDSPTRVIAAGDVLGGFWGPEGALIKQARANAGGNLFGASLGSLADLVEENYGYRPGSIPYLPQWDPANWTTDSQVENPGTKICDFINLSIPRAAEFKGNNDAAKYLPPWRGGVNQALQKNLTEIKDLYDPGYRLAMYNWGPPNSSGYRATTTSINPFNNAPQSVPGLLGTTGQQVGQSILNEINARNIQINFVSKRIKLDFESTPWVADYHVNVNLLHCIPLSDPYGGGRNSSCAWVQKFKDYFVINVAWAGTNVSPSLAEVNGHLPWIHRSDPERFAGFVQTQMNLLGGTPFQNYSPVTIGRESLSTDVTGEQSQDMFNLMMGNDPNFNTGPALFKAGIPLLYPSVTWEVIGISEDNAVRSHGSNGNLMNQKDPTVKTA